MPNFQKYKFNQPFTLTIDNEVQKLNASLAIQLCYSWFKSNPKKMPPNLKFLCNESGMSLEVSDELLKGLENCFWPGRCQLIEFQNQRFFLDGAHTVESVNICIDWFEDKVKNRFEY